MARNNLVKDMVSIIVPIYNSREYLSGCLESVVNQNYKEIEAILVNDGSTDDSGDICQEYAQKDKRIKVMYKENSGPAAARNLGIKNSGGEFIFFLDADDTIERNALELLIGAYKNSKSDLIIGDFKKIKRGIIEKRNDISFEESKLLKKPDLVSYARLYLKKPNKHLLFAFSWGRLFKSSIIKENNINFNEDLHTFEDVAFNFDYLKYVNEAYFLKKSIYNHTIYDNFSSATMTIGSNPQKLLGYQKALENIGNFLNNNISDEDIKKEIGHAYTSLTIIQLVRACGQINKDNKEKIYGIVKNLVNDNNLRESLKYYSPSNGESKVLPFLMKLKFVPGIIDVCRYKSYKRYKNLKNLKHQKSEDFCGFRIENSDNSQKHKVSEA